MKRLKDIAVPVAFLAAWLTASGYTLHALRGDSSLLGSALVAGVASNTPPTARASERDADAESNSRYAPPTRRAAMNAVKSTPGNFDDFDSCMARLLCRD